MRQVKEVFLLTPMFFSPKNHNSIQVHMVQELFLSINLVLTAVKLLNIGYLTLFSYQFTFHVWKRGNQLLCAFQYAESNYFPSFHMRKVITSCVLKRGK